MHVLVVPAIGEAHLRVLMVAPVQPEFERAGRFQLLELEGEYAVVMHYALVLKFIASILSHRNFLPKLFRPSCDLCFHFCYCLTLVGN